MLDEAEHRQRVAEEETYKQRSKAVAESIATKEVRPCESDIFLCIKRLCC